MKNKSARLTKLIAISACMITLSFVLNRFLSFSSTWFRIGLSSLPIVFSSLVLGPIWGGLVGLGADLMAAFLVPLGAYFPGYSIDSALMGILPYFSMKLLKGRNKVQSIVYIGLVSVILVFVSLFVVNFSKFKKIELDNVTRIIIPFVFLFIYVILYFAHLLFYKKCDAFKKYDRNERNYSFSDIFIAGLINHIIISMCLLPYWNLVVANVPYLLTSFTQSVIYLASGVIKPLILYFIINPILNSPVLDFIYQK